MKKSLALTAALASVCFVTLASAQAQEPQPIPRYPKVSAVPVKICTPYYTPEALDARIDGEVTLQVRVGADGTIERARVTKSLDKTYGLDEQAIVAVAKWVFKPATVRGVAVADDDVRITVSYRQLNGRAMDQGGCRTNGKRDAGGSA